MQQAKSSQQLGLEWSDEYQIGHLVVDRQHKQLFKVYNQLVDSFYEGNGQHKVYGVITDLVTYTQNHFRDEEQLMANAGYKGIKAHRQQHQKLIREVETFVSDLDNDAPILTYEVLYFVKCWLCEHILEEDMQLKGVLD